MTEKTVAQLKEHADLIGVTYTSKIRKADLIALIDAREQEIVDAGKDAEPAQDGIGFTSEDPRDTIDGGPETNQYHPKPKLMGLHYRGRALGLKHYQAMGLAIGRTTPPVHKPASHMPNSERVQKYAKANGGGNLTRKQMRRVRKAANKHGEGFMYGNAETWARANGYSVLARTPEGLGIFHQFSN